MLIGNVKHAVVHQVRAQAAILPNEVRLQHVLLDSCEALQFGPLARQDYCVLYEC
jgi:hypothetical protein